MNFFTADLHLSHGNIIKYCHRTIFMNDAERDILKNGNRNEISKLRLSYGSINKMNSEFIASINRICRSDDQLYILGDFCWATNITWARFRRQINCKNIIFIWGNHDPYNEKRLLVSGLFSRTADTLLININHKFYFLSHYAHAVWDKSHFGSRHLYGHSHAIRENWLDTIMPGRFAMDVGIDNAYHILGEYRPFSLDEIEAIMAKRSGFGLIKEKRDDKN